MGSSPQNILKDTSELAQVYHNYALRSQGTVENNAAIPSAVVGSLLDEYNGCAKVCQCPAHKSFRSTSNLLFSDCLGRLPAVLTDHYGSELAEALLPFLFQRGEQRLAVRRCGLGSPYSVNFVLQLLSGQGVYQFTGRPDFYN